MRRRRRGGGEFGIILGFNLFREKEKRKGKRSLGAGRMDKKGYREDGGRQEMRWR